MDRVRRQPLLGRALVAGLLAGAALTSPLIAVAAEPAAGQRPADAPNTPAPRPASAPATDGSDAPGYRVESIRGRLVWLAAALERRYGVESDPESPAIVALETQDGTLEPIVRDARGRGFYKDPRLFEREWELVVGRFPGSPFVKVIRTYVWRDGKRFEFDYWCDICAIPMFELKECECCQGPIRFRERPADPAATP